LEFRFWIGDWGFGILEFNKRDKDYKNGADDYFIKPFSPLGLIRKVEEIFDESKGESYGFERQSKF
jgi:DNA-binding response OmpR family regulator